jgi:hypothetical protein
MLEDLSRIHIPPTAEYIKPILGADGGIAGLAGRHASIGAAGKIQWPSIAESIGVSWYKELFGDGGKLATGVTVSASQVAGLTSLGEKIRHMGQPLTVTGADSPAIAALTGLADSFAFLNGTVTADALVGIHRSIADCLSIEPMLSRELFGQIAASTRRLLDKRAGELLGMSGDDFIRRVGAGDIEIPEDKGEAAEIIVLAELVPLAKKAA